LTLANLQLTNSGNYSAQVTNAFGLTNSATAILTVVPPPPCDPSPAGIIAWWAAESNALDSVALNNGTLVNNTGFTNGEVGSAFKLNGANQYVLVTSSNLNVGAGAGMTFEGWINPANTGTAMPIMKYERVLGSVSGPDQGAEFYINTPNAGGLHVNLGVTFNFGSGLIYGRCLAARCGDL